MELSKPEGILELVDKHNVVTLSDNSATIEISKGADCYMIVQGSPTTGYGQDLYTTERALDFIKKNFKKDIYTTMWIGKKI